MALEDAAGVPEPERFKVWPMSVHAARQEDGRGYVLVEPLITPLEGFRNDEAYYADDMARLARAKGERTITDRKFTVTPVAIIDNRTRVRIEFSDGKPVTATDLDEFAAVLGKVIGLGGTPVEVVTYAKAEASGIHGV